LAEAAADVAELLPWPICGMPTVVSALDRPLAKSCAMALDDEPVAAMALMAIPHSRCEVAS
jgi:hypothetical protein